MTCKVARLSLCLYIRMFCLSLLHTVNCGVSVLALSVTFLFVYEISREPHRPTERICAKFTRTTCLVPRSNEFEGQGQRSKIKVTRYKNTIFGPFGGLRAVCLVIDF